MKQLGNNQYESGAIYLRDNRYMIGLNKVEILMNGKVYVGRTRNVAGLELTVYSSSK